MNDRELLTKLQEQSPQDWTEEEVELLRQRLPHSPELRAALTDELRLERGLQETLGRFEVSLDRIYAQAGPTAAAGTPWASLLAGGLVAAAGIGGAVYWNARPAPEIAQAPTGVVSTAEATTQAAGTVVGTGPSAAASGAAWIAKLPPRKDSDDRPEASAVRPEGGPGAVPNAVAAVEAAPPGEPLPASVKMRKSPSLIEDFQSGGDQAGIDFKTFKTWVTSAPKENVHFFEHHSYPAFDGVLKWKFAWPADGTLRMGLFEPDRLKFHCYAGDEGASFTYCRHPHPNWGAFRALREPGANKPKAMQLVGSDDDRFHRSGRGTIELRYEGGEVILARGGFRLCSVPMAKRPTELVFEGRTGFRGLEWIVAPPLPAEPLPERRIVLQSERPSELAWKTTLPPKAVWNLRPDGAVELSSRGKIDQPAWAATPLPRSGVYEVAFLVEDPQPGTGVCLMDDSGKPLYRVGFFLESQSKKLVFGLMRPDEHRFESWHDALHQPFPAAGPKTWVRMALGAGTLQVHTSADGLRWSQVLEPMRDVVGPSYTQIGLFVQHHDQPHAIRLRQVAVREISPLVDLVPRELLDRAPTLSMHYELGAWAQAVAESRPSEVDAGAWRTACGLKTLMDRPASRLSKLILAGLADDVAESKRPLAEKLPILDAAAELTDGWEAGDAEGMVALYRRAGAVAAAGGDPQPWTAVSSALVRSPLWTAAQVDPLPESLLRQELLLQLYAGRFEALREACRKAAFLARIGYPWQEYEPSKRVLLQWVQWAQATAERALPRQAGEETIPLTLSWRHPLDEQVSKEGFNILAEFSAALKGNSLRDACMIITSSKPDGALGLVPDARDARLWVSLPGAVMMAMKEKPALQTTMEKEFGPLGMLRVREAMNGGDAAGVEAATMQFFGTQAAAEAHLWLGDRALAGGDFAVADNQYLLAQSTASSALRPSLAARRRLAAAFFGKDQGEPPTIPVSLGDAVLSPTEFESLAGEVRSRQGAQSAASDVRSVPPSALREEPAPKMRTFRMQLLERWEGQMGRDQERGVLKGWDPAAEQATSLVAGDSLILHNRFDVAAHDLRTGKRRWRTELGGNQGFAHKWQLVPMRPIVANDRIFVRRLTERGPELAALSLRDGKILWRRQPGHHVASDPFMVQGAVGALCFHAVGQEQFHLELVYFDAEKGDVLSQRRLVNFRNVWDDQPPCQATLSGDRIVCAVGGAVFCCDTLGQMQWVRRQTWVPALGEPGFLQGLHEPPIVEDGRVYVAAPQVKSLDCLDVVSGRLLWTTTIPDLRGLRGLRPDRLIVETEEGFAAVRRKDGGLLWRVAASGRTGVVWCGTKGDLCWSERSDQGSRFPARHELVSVDVETGREKGRGRLEGFTEEHGQIGPLVPVPGRWMILSGVGDKNPRRDLFALESSGDGGFAHGDAPWAGYADYAKRIRDGRVEYALPGWRLIDCAGDQECEIKPDWSGHRNILVMGAAAGQSAWLGREIEVAPGMRLAFEVVARAAGPWQLVVRGDQQVLGTWKVDPDQANGVAKGEVDLTPLAGKRIQLTVEQRMGKAPAGGGWKKLDLLWSEPRRAE